MYQKLSPLSCIIHSLHHVWYQNRIVSLGSSPEFRDLLLTVWSHSYLTCGEVMVPYSKWPRGHSVVQLIVLWWFADLGPHIRYLMGVLVVCLVTAGCVSEHLMACGNLLFILSLSPNVSNGDALGVQCSYHRPSAQSHVWVDFTCVRFICCLKGPLVWSIIWSSGEGCESEGGRQFSTCWLYFNTLTIAHLSPLHLSQFSSFPYIYKYKSVWLMKHFLL